MPSPGWYRLPEGAAKLDSWFFLELLVRFLCVHFLLGGYEGRSYGTASL